MPPHGTVQSIAKVESSEPEIIELARALRNDVDLIYAYVHDYIDHEPKFGIAKGAVGTLLDERGGAFDQANLMAALLDASGYDVNIIYGDITLSQQQLENWLGTQSLTASANLIGTGGIPVEQIGSSLKLRHAWVSVKIGNTFYQFDPSFKIHAITSGLGNLETVLGFNEQTFYSQAEAGATIISSQQQNYVQNINSSNITNLLTNYSENYVNYLKNDASRIGLTLDEVLGGRTIESVTTTVRQTQLPYATTQVAQWSTVPDNFHATLRVELPGAGIDYTAKTKDIYGRRFTLFYSGSTPILRLDGTIVDPGVNSVGSFQTVRFIIDHPFPEGNGGFADTTTQAEVAIGGRYFIVNGWGSVGVKHIEKHRKILAAQQHTGAGSDSEVVVGESLGLIGYNWLAQVTISSRLADNMANAEVVYHNLVGIVGQTDSTYIDMPGVVRGEINRLHGFPDFNLALSDGNRSSILESGVIEQTHGIESTSTQKILSLANDSGIRIYDLRTGGHVDYANLTGYTTDEVNAIRAGIGGVPKLNYILPQNGNIQLNSWAGFGYVGYSGNNGIVAQIINGGLESSNGGFSSQPNELSPPDIQNTSPSVSPNTGFNYNNNPVSADPVDLVSGAFLFESTDLTIGSGPSPFGLGFTRAYTSAGRYQDGPLGLGWSHNYDISVNTSSNGFQGLGEDSAIDAAAFVAATFVDQKVLTSQKPQAEKAVISAIIQDWLMRNLTDNAVIVKAPGETKQFIRLPNGEFSPPPGSADVLSETSGGLTKLETKHGVTTIFHTFGAIASWEDRFGNRISFSYVDGRLDNVSNGYANGDLDIISSDYGRQLNFVYTNDRIAEVNDGLGRSVHYRYDTVGNLIKYKSANGAGDEALNAICTTSTYCTTYDYSEGDGLLTKVFEPAHPNTAIVTNRYDMFDRIWEQDNSSGHTFDYYFSGYRTEEVNPLNESSIWHYNKQGKPIVIIDGLNNVIVRSYDGQNRLTEEVLPEGNGTSYQYDTKHNVTRITGNAKLGSGLAPLVQEFAYTSDFNLVKTITDPRQLTTEHFYDVAGKLEETHFPAVTEGTPIARFVHLANGLLLTSEDPSGIVTEHQYEYLTGNHIAVYTDRAHFGNDLSIFQTYNDFGFVDARGSVSGPTLTYEVDNEGRVTKETADYSPTSLVTDFVRDKNGRVRWQERPYLDANNNSQIQRWNTTYYFHGGVSVTTDPSNISVEHHYDQLERLERVIDDEGKTIEYQYDEVGRIETVFQLVGTQLVPTASYTYTPNGQLHTVKDANDNITTFTYDGHDRPLRTIYPDTSYEETLFDGSGNKKSWRNRSGQTTTYEYDGLNRLYEEIRPEETITYTYWPLSRRTKDAISTKTGTFSFDYDTAGRLTSSTNPDDKTVIISYSQPWGTSDLVSKITYPNQEITEYSYDRARLTNVYPFGEPSGGVQDGNNIIWPIQARYGYDGLSRLAWRRARLIVTSLGYEPNNQLQSLKYDFLETSSWSFSPQVILTENEIPIGPELDFTYNFAGEYDSKTVSQDHGPSLWQNPIWVPNVSEIIGYTPNDLNQYDDVGGTQISYDANGNLTSDGVNIYTYDSHNQLVGVSAPGKNVTLEYDPFGRIYSKTVNGQTTTYVYQGFNKQVLEEYTGSGTLRRRYILGGRVNGPEAMVQNGDIYFYHYDETQSVSAIFRAVDGQDDQIVAAYTYGPYGETTVKGNFSNPYRYTGQYFDDDIGLYNYHARFYSPKLGRFLQPDPIGYGDGLNLYAYAYNNPVNFLDLYGLQGSSLSGGYDFALFPTTTGNSQFGLGLPTLPQGLVDFSAGVGDGIIATMTIGFMSGGELRDSFGISVGINQSSSTYNAGLITGTAGTLAAQTFAAIPSTLTHFTTSAGAAGIAASGSINASRSGLFGAGIYASSIGPFPSNPFVPPASTIAVTITNTTGFVRAIPGTYLQPTLPGAIQLTIMNVIYGTVVNSEAAP